VTDGKQLFDTLWAYYRQQLSPEGMSALDFAQLVSYLIFLKIDDERSQRPLNPVRVVPAGLGWQSLVNKDGSILERQFRHVLQECGKLDTEPRTLIRQAVFRAAVPDLRCTPASLHSFIKDVIAETRWSDQSRADLRDMYRLLMEEASADFLILSGQTLTPEPLVSVVIDCLRPNPSDVVLDPACGTGSLLVAAQQSMARAAAPLAPGAVTGADFDPIMCRFTTMNYLLSTGDRFDSPPPAQLRNSLAEPGKGNATVIVCNPPFRSTAPLPAGRTDLWATSGSMQLNFLQHIARSLPIDGRAAVFVPDNILFAEGADATVRRNLLQQYDVHTVLRLPTGVFARGGVKTNVIFFDAVRPRGDGSPATNQVWVYDFRSGMHFAARQRPLHRSDLDDFERCYGYGEPRASRAATDRFRPVSYQYLAETQFKLDILWRDEIDPEEGASPREIAFEIVDELTAALNEFRTLASELPDAPIRDDL
jgi:type I restriction enzyme M protein